MNQRNAAMEFRLRPCELCSFLPVYLLHMIQLPETHPEAQMMLENGEFGVQRTAEHGFAQLPIDQIIQQTLNRSTKTKGGIVGFSLKKTAVQRWLLTAHSGAFLLTSVA